MTTIFAMRGYPGSGKSTEAIALCKHENAVRVNRDELRHMLYGQWFGGNVNEDVITELETKLVKENIIAGRSVVIDAMHLQRRYLVKWQKLAALYGVGFQVIDIATPVDECVRRVGLRNGSEDHGIPNTADGRTVPVGVVKDLGKKFPINDWPQIPALDITVEPYSTHGMSLPTAVIFDLDGTLAHYTKRSPYDYTDVLSDRVDHNVAWIAGQFEGLKEYDAEYCIDPPGSRIIIMTGRDDTCRADTIKWLELNDIYYDDLFMRPTGQLLDDGKAPDWIVKLDLFNKHIRGKYDVKAVFDDRDQVLVLWRRLGLTALQCAPGDF
jgi:predicted kinase